MNTLEVSMLSGSDDMLTLLPTSRLLDRYARHPIRIAPWPAFPYKPAVFFSIAHYNTGITIKYFVREENIRAANTQINGRVWEDSCVEFFISFKAGGSYYNFEFNCTGTGLIGYGPDKTNRELLPAETVGKVKAQALINSRQQNEINWELTLLIPVEVFIHTSVGLLSGKTCTANFYKCGDLLPQPHFLAWSDIQSLSPDFHLPDSFGQIHFR